MKAWKAHLERDCQYETDLSLQHLVEEDVLYDRLVF